MWLYTNPELENCASPLQLPYATFECPAPSSVPALLTCQFELWRLNVESLSLTVCGHLQFTPSHRLLPFSILLSLNIIHSSKTADYYPHVAFSSPPINGVTSLSCPLSPLCVSTVLPPPPAHLLLGDSVHHALLHLPR